MEGMQDRCSPSPMSSNFVSSVSLLLMTSYLRIIFSAHVRRSQPSSQLRFRVDYHQGFFVTVRAGTEYRHLFEEKKIFVQCIFLRNNLLAYRHLSGSVRNLFTD